MSAGAAARGDEGTARLLVAHRLGLRPSQRPGGKASARVFSGKGGAFSGGAIVANAPDGTHLRRAPLHEAAVAGNAGMTRLLLESGANPEVRTANGETPLMLAAKNGRLIQAELMLLFKPDVSLKDYTGRGPLGWARQSRNPQIVRLLERAGFFD